MLNIYYADALTDKERFIFDHVDPTKQTILLVPDQFSLQAEQDALQYCGSTETSATNESRSGGAAVPMPSESWSEETPAPASKATNTRALLNLMVTDFSALGHKVVKETQGHEPEIIDKYGRHMLLSVLLERMDEELTVFRSRGSRRGSRGTSALAEQMNTMISELKRYEVSPENLEQVIDQLKQESDDPTRAAGNYLVLKLEDTLRIYRAYEESIQGIYQDAEDYITYYADRIPKSRLLQGSDVWIHGFDTFTPKNLLVIRRLLETADNVSVVLTYENDEEAKPSGEPISDSPNAQTSDSPSASTSEPSNETSESGASPQSTTAIIRSLTQAGGAGLFRLTEQVIQRLEQTADEAGIEHRRERINGIQRKTIWDIDDTSSKQSDCELQRQISNEQKQQADANSATDEARSDSHPDTYFNAQSEALQNLDALHTTLQRCITLVQTSGLYEEAESAAAFIQSLVRDRGYRYGEIAVLCNDMDGRGRQLLRAFERWEIPAFADQKRKVLHQPVVSFLLSFLEVLTDGLGGSGIIGMIKSGLLGWSIEEEALLENYMTEFRIRGARWEHEFVWDGGKYTPEELNRLNEMREFLVEVCSRAKDAIGRRNTAAEKVHGLMEFLQEDFRILERIQQTVERQQELHLMEGAAETAQIWNAICGILDQVVQVIGPKRISNDLLRDMITKGLSSLEIGLVPASRDCVLMGTLQRSRPGRIRALIITGANAGLLPLDMTDEGLLSRREKQKLESLDMEFAGRERVAQMEEQLAIYRMFSLPSEHLYVSCSQSADDGSMLRPSEIFQVLQQWQPEVLGDLSERAPEERVGSRRATVPYLAEAMREQSGKIDGEWSTMSSNVREYEKADETVRSNSMDVNGGTDDDGSDAVASGNSGEGTSFNIWQQVLGWYQQNDPQQANRLLRGAQFNNHIEALGEDLADALYRGDREALNVSASRLEKYSGCPFAHFVQYGLRAEEQRLFEVGGREIGDVYHQCMMEFSRELEEASEEQCRSAQQCGSAEQRDPAERQASADTDNPNASEQQLSLADMEEWIISGDEADDSATASDSLTWNTITEAQCREKIAAILQTSAAGYREGLFASDGYSQFRLQRITEICGDIAWALVEQVRQGKIRRMYFEAPFGNRRAAAYPGDVPNHSMYIPAIEVDAGGRKVRIQGTIDRLDVIDTGEGAPEAIRIVDYKTGNNTVRVEDFETGYKLQLMVYMDAALRAEHDSQGGTTTPSGVSEEQDATRDTTTELQPTDETHHPRPAGVFYFKIRDFNIDGDQTAGVPDAEDPEDLRQRMEKFYRMEGVMVNDPALIGAMDERVDGTEKAESMVIPVKYDPKKEAYVQTGGGTLLESEEFQQLLEATNRQVERICGEICRGEIAAMPKRETKSDWEGNRITACRYCGFRSICGFDPSIKSCKYVDV